MPYDKSLAERIRKAIKSQRSVTEKEMFGGIGFMVRGNVACGVIGNEMMVRVGPEGHESALKEPDVRPFDMTGKPSKGWVMVRSGGLKKDADLRRWVKRGVAFALTLPPK
ncbi:MAG: TfoX/Sxy family protein [Deltaproteobacteria bacterium]|nr:TfoX/Sxy family protein [Deltaproteobacteria bacterium]